MKAVSLGASAVGAEVEGFTCATFGFTKVLVNHILNFLVVIPYSLS